MLQRIENKVVQIVRNDLVCISIFAKIENNKTIVTSITLNNPKLSFPAQENIGANADLKKIEHALNVFLKGQSVSFDFIALDFSLCTSFQEKVLKAARKIPRGSIVSYSDLAAMAGYPSAIRAVASVMRNNRFPLIIPCHRVVTKPHFIGGFMGVKNGWPIVLKRKLLVLEGVQVAQSNNQIIVQE